MAAMLLAGVASAYAAPPSGGDESGAGEFWTIMEIEGAAETLDGNLRRNASAGFVLRSAGAVRTSANGHVTLKRGGDTVRLSHSSRIGIPEEASGNGFWQSLGRVLFEMDSRDSRDFEIHTPLLVSAIKGTTFIIEVEFGRERVVVMEGSVEVTARESGDVTMVGAGQIATVMRGDGKIALTGVQDNRIFQDIHADGGDDDDTRTGKSNQGKKGNPPGADNAPGGNSGKGGGPK